VTDSTSTRTWFLPARGDVQYATPSYDNSLNALACLSSDMRDNIRLTLTNWQPKKDGLEQSLTLRYDLMSGNWKTASGTALGVNFWKTESESQLGANLGPYQSILLKRLDTAAEDLNKALLAPQNVHQRLIALSPRYDSGLAYDRPAVSTATTLRVWRRADVDWMSRFLATLSNQDAGPKDVFDRAFGLLSRLDRPSDILWDMQKLTPRGAHFRLYTPACLQHCVVRLRRSDFTLKVSKSFAATAAENQCRVVLSEQLALAQAIRLFAADKAGTVILSAYQVEALDSCDAKKPILQMRIDSRGWLSGLGKLEGIILDRLLDVPLSGIDIIQSGHPNWNSPKFDET